MASTIRECNHSVEKLLFKQPQTFSFFQAVRLLRLIRMRGDVALSPANISLDSLVRFRTRASLEFPAAEIYDLIVQKRDITGLGEPSAPELVVAFMGLTGQSGVLPQMYTELLIERWWLHKDDTAHRFFDLFSHRAIALFVHAWEKYRFYLAYERRGGGGITRYLLDLVGVGSANLRGRVAAERVGLKEEPLAYYSGLLAQRPPSSSNLGAVLSDYFGVKVAIKQCCGRWLSIPRDFQTSLGQKNNQLGDGLVLGDRAWDYQSKFRVILGPLTLAHYQSFLPDGTAYHALVNFVRWFAGPALDFDILLILKKEEVPMIRVGAEPGCRLGWLGWLKSKPFNQDTHDTVLMEGRKNG